MVLAWMDADRPANRSARKKLCLFAGKQPLRRASRLIFEGFAIGNRFGVFTAASPGVHGGRILPYLAWLDVVLPAIVAALKREIYSS
jgi:hypothetical protein